MIAYDQVGRETNIPSNRNAEIRGLAHLHFVKPGLAAKFTQAAQACLRGHPF
jgi:hypothetical protein